MSRHHTETLPVRQWVKAECPYVVTGTYKLKTADQQNNVLYINHEENKAPIAVFAYIEKHAKGSANSGDTTLASGGPHTTFVFASVPLINGEVSKSQIAILIPDIATSDATIIRYTMLFFEGNSEDQITQD